MNKKFLKALALVGCALLLVTASVVGTYAFLTAKTATVTNTFTVGNVTITLDEAKVDLYGVKDGDVRVEVDTDKTVPYKLIPGRKYTKDPVITVGADSESCWLFVKVENGISAIEGGTTIASQLGTNGWTALDDVDNVYYMSWAAGSAVKVPVFGSFTIATDANVASYVTAKIIVTAYAVQAEGFGTAEAAWGATFGTTPNP